MDNKIRVRLGKRCFGVDQVCVLIKLKCQREETEKLCGATLCTPFHKRELAKLSCVVLLAAPAL